MYSVDSSDNIYLTRGDTLSLELTLYEDYEHGIEYTPQEGDTIRFALKRNQFNVAGTEYTDQTPLILKNIPTDTMKLEILPAETKSLGFGTYAYDIEMTYANGVVDTFIGPAMFVIGKEVH